MRCTPTVLVGCYICICLLSAVQAASQPQADNAAAAVQGPAGLGMALKAEHTKAAAKPEKAVATAAAATTAAVKPAAYRGKDSTGPGSPAHNAGHDTYTRPGYSTDYSRIPKTDAYPRAPQPPSYPQPSYGSAGSYGSYPNANPGYPSRDYEAPEPYYPSAPRHPLRGTQPSYPRTPGYDNSYPSGPGGYSPTPGTPAYGYDSYASSGGYNDMQQYPGSPSAGYQQPYNAANRGGYAASREDPYMRGKTQPQEPYWHSYRSAAPGGSGAGYYPPTPAGSDYTTAYGRDRAGDYARNQPPQKWAYAYDGAYAGAPAGKVHQPTVVHMEDPYKQRQQQQLLSSVLAGGVLGSSGGYGGAYRQQSPYGMGAGGMAQRGYADSSSQWWRDHQAVQDGAKLGSSADKLEAVLSLINKLVP